MRKQATLFGTDRTARLVGMVIVNTSIAVCLVIIYLAVAAVIQWLVPIDRLAAHMLATVAVAISVIPLRRRAQAAVMHLLRREWQGSERIIREVGQALNHAVEPLALHTTLCEDLPRRLRLEGATLWMLEPPDDRLYAVVAPPPSAGATFLPNGSLARWLEQIDGYSLLPAEHERWLLPLTSQHVYLVLPLWAGERLVGIYGCGKPLRGQHPPRLVFDLLLTLAPAIASAVENTRAYTTIARLHNELRKLDQLKDAFIENVGHELRTPLTTLSLAVQLLATQQHPSPLLVQMSYASLVQLQSIVDRVLLFEEHNRHAAQRASNGSALIELRPMIAEVVAYYAPIAQARNGAFQVTIPPGLAAWGQQEPLRRALNEIIDNALRYTTELVSIQAYSDDGLAIISVSDNGPGIPLEDQARLFDAFYRGRDTRALADTPGAGLGMSIARRDIEQLGGRIWLERSDSSGTDIRLALPAAVLEIALYEREAGA